MLDKRLLQEAKFYRHRFMKLCALSFMNALCVVSIAYYLTEIIGGVFLSHSNLAKVVPYFTVLLFVMLLKAIVSWQSEIVAHGIAGQVKTNLRTRLLQHLTLLGPIPIAGEQTGELISTLTDGIEQLDSYFTKFLPQMIVTAVIPITLLTVTLSMDLLTAVIFILTAPLIPVFMMLIGRLANQANSAQWHTLTKLSAHFLDVIEGLSTLKIFNQSIAQIRTIERLSNEFRDVTLQVLRLAFLSALVLELVATLSVAMVAVMIGLRLLEDQISFHQAFFLLLLAPEFYLPLRQLGAAFHAAMSGTAAAERIYQILSLPLATQPQKSELPPELNEPLSIRFHAIYAAYKGGRNNALNGLDLTIEAGKHIAIVGMSGAGKTTIMHLLLQFIQPTKGEIYVNNFALKGLTAADWRQKIAYVPQSPHIFALTAAENIALAKPGASISQIESAAKAAKAHDFILALPKGYQTPLGGGGRPLSGGQLRRIALARAFLQDAPLMILDEAMTGLDPETETVVEASLAALTQGKTVITIAHRLHAAVTADQVIVIENGQVAEMGTHAELLKTRGAYFTLLSASRGAQ